MEHSREILWEKLTKLADSFQTVLYEEDETFMKNMKTKSLAKDDISKYRFWEWTQGVGLFGFWKMFKETGKKEYLDVLVKFYDRQLSIGFPSKNVNTVTPLLTMLLVGDYTKRQEYLDVCREWAEWIMESFPRTKEGGFQHITSDSENDSELWDDTLYMTVLFLAYYGKMFGKEEYIEEATYQFLLHIKYLADKETGLWFHGWSFNEKSNFANALWGRGNCWVTMVIPEFLSIVKLGKADERFITEAYKRQCEALKDYQDVTGMWHTLIDDPSSYEEASATCGFAYGMLKGVRMGLIDKSFEAVAKKALAPILNLIDENGVVNQVSYGTPMGRVSKDFYKEIPIKSMPYGQAMAMLFLITCLP